MRKNSPSTGHRESLRELPSVDRLLLAPAVQSLKLDLPHHLQVELARDVLATARAAIINGDAAPSLDVLAQSLQRTAVQRFLPSLQPTINATGVISAHQFGARTIEPGRYPGHAGGERRLQQP